jgi:transposase
VCNLKEAVMTATTRSEWSVSEPTLYVGLELSQASWKLALTSGMGVKPVLQTVAPGDAAALVRVLAAARRRLDLPAETRVVSCYEAGRDGFWIHRWLTTLAVENRVVDSASIEVSRRAKRAKTDRLDALKLVAMLVRVCQGERGVWREVRVPTAEAEATRHGSRERARLVQDRTALRNQVRSWLVTCGTAVPRHAEGAWWTTVRDWAGAPLAAALQARLARAAARLALLEAQIAELDAAQVARVAAAPAAGAAQRLLALKGVATTSAATLLDEGLVWRAFRNRREVGALLGFSPTPFASGALVREQGISRAGNARLQSTMIQLAWQWVRWQRLSPLTHWFHAHFGAGRRPVKVGIVAVARKLLIALWRWATAGIVPEGALLKA